MTRVLALCALLAAAPAGAMDLPLPEGAEPVFSESIALGSHALPVAPLSDGVVPTVTFEGRVMRRTWRLPPGKSSLEILAPMRAALVAEGYDIVLDCADRACGGFQFRFGIEVVPAPDMYVNLRDFRVLSAIRDGREATGVLVSASATATYVQQVDVTAEATPGRP